ncbi:TetR/AcrR family transcriptional regulator [Nocardioides sp.]|uniref:TetR/AcrR family transcriptional regulator n=1 Tax=Nocardioides sp. TaxID=35761 RepID=UPI00356B046B
MLGETKRNRISERREATRREIVEAAWQVARERGLAEVTLREIARRVGMQAPSLYGHVASKNEIYDAMFAQAWTQFHEGVRGIDQAIPEDRERALIFFARHFFDFAVHDPVRYQLMNQRTIPGFEPSPEAYAPAVAVLEDLGQRMAEFGITEQEDVDLWVALIGGLVNSQLANDPGGDRWGRLLERTARMYLRDLDLTTAGTTPVPTTNGDRSRA